MLNLYAYSFVALMHQLEDVEDALTHEVAASPQSIWPRTILENQLSLALKIAGSLADQLGLESTKREVNRISSLCSFSGLKSEILARVKELKIRIEEDLRAKHFFYVPDLLAIYYGKDELFGSEVPKKFKGCGVDIREAGNCLALNQPTACVFHLMRAMEIAVRALGRRLKVTITPQSTWRKMTGEMDDKIKKMADNTDLKKEKKNKWEASRANLHHVGSVWRNNTMHPAASYTQQQALDVLNATRVFMVGLCEL
jgi:hypothetical protein